MWDSGKTATTMPGYGYDQVEENVPERTRIREPRTKMQWLAFFVSILALIFTFIIMIVIIQWTCDSEEKKDHRRQKHVISEDNIVCVSCSKLELAPLEASPLKRHLIKTYKDGVEMCCAGKSHQMSALLELMVNKREAKPVASGQVFSQMSAHKRLLPINPDTGARPLKFSPEESGIEHKRGVDVDEDFLYIEHTGIYYVYASLHVNASSSHASEIFYGDIYRISGSQSAPTGVLTKVAHKVCRDCALDEGTTFGAGIFKLFEGDRIQIRTENSNMMAFKQDSCYVGLVILGGGQADKDDQLDVSTL